MIRLGFWKNGIGIRKNLVQQVLRNRHKSAQINWHKISHLKICHLTFFVSTISFLKYSLELSVTDGEFTSYATLVVKVTDVNDNPPVFERSSYRTQITEEDDRNLPRRILQVKRKLQQKLYIPTFVLLFGTLSVAFHTSDWLLRSFGELINLFSWISSKKCTLYWGWTVFKSSHTQTMTKLCFVSNL